MAWDVKLVPSAVLSTIQEYIPSDKQFAVTQEYLKQLNGSSISVDKLWKLCTAAGWDISQPLPVIGGTNTFQNRWATPESPGITKCRDFVFKIISRAAIKFRAACGPDDNKKQGSVCVASFFSNEYLGGTQVNLNAAIALSKEYARLKFGKRNVYCDTKPREISVMLGATDYGIQCTTDDNKTFYEFIFDDVKEPKDTIIQNNIQDAVCKMHNSTPTIRHDVGGGSSFGGNYTHIPASCSGDKSKCAKINESMTKFGYSAIYRNNRCEINFETVRSHTELKTAYGIDNFVFCHGIQVENAPTLDNYLKQYIAQYAGVSTSAVECNSGFNTYTGAGCAYNGISDFKDDIKTCYVGDNQIDFVFDDVNEKWKKTSSGGLQGMSCIVAGGTYSGKRCVGLGQQQCDILRKSNLNECPECQAAYWDPKTQSCILPSSVSATNLQRGINIGLIVGGTVVGVVITVTTGGTGTAIVLTALETAGAAIEINSQLNIDGMADAFLVKSNRCKDASCAQDLVHTNLIELARIQTDLTAAEANAIDSEMARLIGLIPTDSDWWLNNLRNQDGTSFLALADDGGWTSDQIWRAVGIGMQFAGVATAVTRWILTKTGYLGKTMSKTSQILLKNAKIAQENLVHVDELDEIGKEWHRLWQEYAPKNQTLTDFMDMADNDLDKMKKMAQDWTPRSKRIAQNAQHQQQLDAATADLQRKTTAWEDLMNKYEIDAIPSDPYDAAELYTKYPDLEQATQAMNNARATRTNLINQEFDYTSNYSTYDPEFNKTVAPKIKELNNMDKTVADLSAKIKDYNKQIDDYYNELVGKLRRGENTAELEEIIVKAHDEQQALMAQLDATNAKRTALTQELPSQWEIAEQTPLKNIGNVANERANDFAEIVANNPEIKSKLDNQIWSKLPVDERRNIMQQILDEYAKKTGTPNTLVDAKILEKEIAGAYTPVNKSITFNSHPRAGFTNSSSAVNTASHEHGHFIDDVMPNEGALGEQYSHYAQKIYTSNPDQGYRVALTEQSSFDIGPTTSTELSPVTHSDLGTTDYSMNVAKTEAQKEKIAPAIQAAGGVGGFTTGVGANTVKQEIKEEINDKRETK